MNIANTAHRILSGCFHYHWALRLLPPKVNKCSLLTDQPHLTVWVSVFLPSNLSTRLLPSPTLRLPWAAPDASQYCPCIPLDSKQCEMRVWKQISVSVFWPPSGKQEQRGHVRNSELNSDLNLENKGRALWGRTMKLCIPNFKSLCWRQAVWTWLHISNAHRLPFQKQIFCCGFCPPPPPGGFWAEWQYQTLREAEFL